MTPREAGFLLLTSHLGDPARLPLTAAQLRLLAACVRGRKTGVENRSLTAEDIQALGCSRVLASRAAGLLENRELLELYLYRGRKAGCEPLTRVSVGYPEALRRKLAPDCPGTLWISGNRALLKMPKIALVGNRELRLKNREFAREAGRQAARQGLVLVSGNARGADREAQDACLSAGGKVISVVADSMVGKTGGDDLLYLSEDSFDLPFSARRAISRNRVIHCLGQLALVAQCSDMSGGTWDGTIKNLRGGWSPVFCFEDGTAPVKALCAQGAAPIRMRELTAFDALQNAQMNFFGQG